MASTPTEPAWRRRPLLLSMVNCATARFPCHQHKTHGYLEALWLPSSLQMPTQVRRMLQKSSCTVLNVPCSPPGLKGRDSVDQAHLRTHSPGLKPHSVTAAFRQHRQIPFDPPSLGVAFVRQRRGIAPPGTSQQTCSSRCPSGRTTARTRRCEHWSPTGSGRQQTHGRDIIERHSVLR